MKLFCKSLSVITVAVFLTVSGQSSTYANSGDFKIKIPLGISLGETVRVQLSGIGMNSGWCAYRAIKGSGAYPGWFEYPSNFKVVNGKAATKMSATIPGRVHVSFICSANRNPSYSDKENYQAWTNVVIKNF